MKQQERNNAEHLAFVHAVDLAKKYKLKAENYKRISIIEAIIFVIILFISWGCR